MSPSYSHSTTHPPSTGEGLQWSGLCRYRNGRYSNRVTLELNVSLTPSAFLIEHSYDNTHNVVRVVLQPTTTATPIVQLVIQLPTLVQIDGGDSYVQMNPLPTYNTDTHTLRLVFPYFTMTLSYDPNVGILLGGGGGDGGSGDNILSLVLGLSIGLGGAAVVVVMGLVVVGVVLAVLVHRARVHHANLVAVNFTGKEDL